MKKRGLSLLFLLATGCAGPARLAPGALQFAVLGDTPYSVEQAGRLDRLIDSLNAEPAAFVVHVGDIGTSAQACTDAWQQARKAQFGRIRAPFVLLPGDNEWSDCHAVGLDPAERLEAWRRRFCGQEQAAALKLERQPGAYCEHIRWRQGGTLFATLNLPGNDNNRRQPAELAARMRAVYAWMDEAEKLAPERLVLFVQANPYVAREGYAELRERLAALAARMPGRVALVHGDTHLYKYDEPAPGLTRIEVWGAPIVAWTRLVIEEGMLRPGGSTFF